MKKFMSLLFVSFIFSSLAHSAERLGPESVKDYWLETGLGIYTHNTNIKHGDDKIGAGFDLSVYYVKPEFADVGISALALDWGQGLFLTGLKEINNEIEFKLGLGVMGYDVDNGITEYYTHEPAAIISLSYRTGYGLLTLGYLLSESEKNNYITTTEQNNGDNSPQHRKPKPKPISTTNKIKTKSRHGAIMLGLNIPLR